MTQEDWAKLPLFVKRSMEIIPIREELSSFIESTGKNSRIVSEKLAERG